MSKNFFLVTLSRIQKSGALFDINNPDCYQSAEPSISGRRTMMLTCTHYLTIRFEVFLAVVVGSFATPLSTNIIIAIEYCKVIYSGVKIIYQYKYGNDKINLEGR